MLTFTLVISVALLLVHVNSFVTSRSQAIKTFKNRYTKIAVINNDKNEAIEAPKKKFKITDLIQLIAMGAGAPGLGEFDRYDSETGKLFFKLEGNNLFDSKGESVQTKAKFFSEGYVEGNKNSDFAIKPPGFWANLLSGGKLQTEWEEQMQGKL